MTAGIFPINITDYMLIFITLPVVSCNRGGYFVTFFRDHSKECLDRFERSLNNYAGASVVGNDINNAVYEIIEKLYHIYMYMICDYR